MTFPDSTNVGLENVLATHAQAIRKYMSFKLADSSRKKINAGLKEII